MTREDKLYSMRMQELVMVADKLGIKINTKAAKSQAIEKILAAEEMNKQNEKELANEEKRIEKIVEEVKNEKPIQKTPNKSIEEPKDAKAEETTKKPVKEPKKANLKLSKLTYKGETKSIKEWAAEIKMPRATLYDRVNRNGWPIDLAIETPLGQRRPKNKEA